MGLLLLERGNRPPNLCKFLDVVDIAHPTEGELLYIPALDRCHLFIGRYLWIGPPG